MHNVYTDFIKYLQFLPLEYQLIEIDLFIDDLNNYNHPNTNTKKYITEYNNLKN